MRGSCRTLIGLEASGIRAFRDSLKKNQHRVRGVVWHAGQGRPMGTDILALPWGWMVVAEWNHFRAARNLPEVTAGEGKESHSARC